MKVETCNVNQYTAIARPRSYPRLPYQARHFIELTPSSATHAVMHDFECSYALSIVLALV